MIRNFAVFYFPGTPRRADVLCKPVEEWDIAAALKIAEEIKKEYNCVVYGFYFTARDWLGDETKNAYEVKRSGMYYLGGEIVTLGELRERNDPGDEIMISNMEDNKYGRVIEYPVSWRFAQPFFEGDSIIGSE